MATGFQLGAIAARVGRLVSRLCRLLVGFSPATTRTWARGVTTSYSYTSGSSLAAIDYSDDTPDVAFQYDRLGRMTSAIVAGISTNAYTYDPETLALTAETQNGMEIATPSAATQASASRARPTPFSTPMTLTAASSRSPRRCNS
jgi:hypothetical protein